MQYLNDRLQELDEEKEELKKYQQLDRQRKSLEYTIYDKELHDAKQQLMKAYFFFYTTHALFAPLNYVLTYAVFMNINFIDLLYV